MNIIKIFIHIFPPSYSTLLPIFPILIDRFVGKKEKKEISDDRTDRKNVV